MNLYTKSLNKYKTNKWKTGNNQMQNL